MDFLWKTDWGRVFIPEMSLPEILVRGTLTYLGLYLLLRFVLKRQTGQMSLSDLLVVALVAGVCRNPLVRDTYSVTDGLLVVTTVLAWSFALDWLCFHSPWLHKLLHAPPVAVIRDGRVLEENLRGELMTEGQLRSKLRQNGVREPAEVEEAWIEGDGQVSVVKRSDHKPDPLVSDRASGESEPEKAVPDPATAAIPPADPKVKAFLHAAGELEETIARHREAIAGHERAIAEVEEALAPFGLRLKDAVHHRPRKRTATPRPSDREK
jgi:uncharacterized membrane protein YcaP (DUF421 family)